MNAVCDAFRRSLSAELDGGVHAESDAQHALVCEPCRDFQRHLAPALAELTHLRGTPVADLWPRLAARVRDDVAAQRRRVAGSIVATLLGAAASWLALSLVTARGLQTNRARSEIQRALAVLSSARDAGTELEHFRERPELRLLASLTASDQEDR